MHDFRKLQVWHRARNVVVMTDRMTRQFPRVDHGVIAAQMRRAVISIPANIAEGCGKSSRKETVRFLTSRRDLRPKLKATSRSRAR